MLQKSIVKGYNQLQEALEILHELTIKVHHQGMEKVVQELINRLESPFTFVIVGEVKAGKSSFVNALLDTDVEVCKVAAHPMTDTIQQIVYGDQQQVETITPHVRKIYQPVEILKEITIVDTPGTNSIVDHHQEITERFIPYSDLIVFVFEAKNPYRESAWRFFDFINEEWRKKIIFILQQKDLMNEEDLQTNINGVHEHASRKGIQNPTVFAVSAKLEVEGRKDESGFQPLREYLNNNITGGKAPMLKLRNNVDTVQKINQTIEDSLNLRFRQYEADQNFRLEIKNELMEQSARSQKQADLLVENLVGAYNRITQEKIDKLENELGFFKIIGRSLKGIFSKEANLKEWLASEAKDLEMELNGTLKDKLNNGIIDVADQIQLMCKMIDAKLKSSTTILGKEDALFADIAEKRANILRDLQQSFKHFLEKSDNFYDKNIQATTSNVGSDLAAGGGLAVVGVILTALTNGAVFDITGGILTAIGVIFAGTSLGLRKGKLIREFKREVEKGRENLKHEVSDRLNEYIKSITSKMDGIFIGLDQHLEREEKALADLTALSKRVTDKVSKI